MEIVKLLDQLTPNRGVDEDEYQRALKLGQAYQASKRLRDKEEVESFLARAEYHLEKLPNSLRFWAEVQVLKTKLEEDYNE